MATVPRPETFGALRATHEAVRIARQVGYPPIDLSRVHCDHCGVELNWNRAGIGFMLTCPKCGHETPVPAHLRPYTETPVPVERAGPSYACRWYLCHEETPLEFLGDLSAPRWLVVLFLGLLLLAPIVGITIVVAMK